MEIQVSQDVIDTVCNSLRASKQSLRNQVVNAASENKRVIVEAQLTAVEEALRVFEYLES